MSKIKNGYLMISREVVSTPIWVSEMPFDYRSAYIDLLFKAHFQAQDLTLRTGRTIHINKGQVFVSIKTLENQWHWSKGKVMRYLKTLNHLGLIQFRGTADGTTITIVNYGLEALGRTANDTADGTTDDTTGGTTDGTTGGPQYNKSKLKTNNKGENKENKERSAQKPPFSPNGKEYQ